MLGYVRRVQKIWYTIDIHKILTIPYKRLYASVLHFLLIYISVNWTFLSLIKCDICQTHYSLLYQLFSYIISLSHASVSHALSNILDSSLIHPSPHLKTRQKSLTFTVKLLLSSVHFFISYDFPSDSISKMIFFKTSLMVLLSLCAWNTVLPCGLKDGF